MKLHNQIFIGMAVGVVVGLGLYYSKGNLGEGFGHILFWLDLFGPTLFVGALKMIIGPLIFASIVTGVTSLPNLGEMGAIGWKTMAYYITTTTIAVVIGLVFVLTLQPGKQAASVKIGENRRAEIEVLATEYEARNPGQMAFDDAERTKPTRDFLEVLFAAKGEQYAGEKKFERIMSARERTAGEIFKNEIVKPILTNPVKSFAETNALGLIFFALLMGIACTVVGQPADPVASFFRGLNDVMMQITHWLMVVSPFAVGCIMAHEVAQHGPEIFESLGWYCITVIVAIGAHVAVLIAIAKLIGGIGPLALWRGLSDALLISFSTRSSAATLPVTVANVTEELEVSPKVANFTLPLGATINMDGTALYEGVAIIFLIQIFGGMPDVGLTMTFMTTLLIFITAVVASVGAAAVPSAGLVTMVIVANAVHLPVYYIPLIFAVDTFLDQFRTATNVLGDSVGAIVVNRLEAGKLGDDGHAKI